MSDKNTIWDLIVIGSGASGGRIAKNLTDKGAKVLLLEAGEHFKASDFPKSEFQASLDLYWSGGAELDVKGKIGFLRGKGVGGTTLVNQALLDRFDQSVWSEWQDRSGIDFLELGIDKAYDKVEKSLTIQSISKSEFGKNTQKFIEAFDKKSIQWAPLKRGQSHCNGYDCMKCLGGCPKGSKQSTLVTSVEPAMKKGLTVLDKTEVKKIADIGQDAFVFATRNNKELKFQAKKIVLAAGSFGTTELLLRSEILDISHVLGENISCHPQFMVYSLFDETIDAHKASFQAVKSADPELRKQGIKFENVFAPPIGTSMLLEGYGKAHQAKMLQYRNLASMEVAVRDEPLGKMYLNSKGKKFVEKKMSDQDQKRSDLGVQMIQDMYSQIGAKEIFVGQEAFGLHLMGGSQMGVSEANSIVSPEFHLHAAPNIYCADSSVFPSSSGINPSLTVMALSELASDSIARSLSL